MAPEEEPDALESGQIAQPGRIVLEYLRLTAMAARKTWLDGRSLRMGESASDAPDGRQCHWAEA
jgi:hypothetical protein